MATELEDLKSLVQYWRTHTNPGCQYCADQLERLLKTGELPKPLPTKEELNAQYVFLDKETPVV